MPTRVRSFCKINLGLAVGPARADGFHGLTTMYQTIGLQDVVTVSARRAEETRITLTSNHRSVPTTEAGNVEKNTAWRMVFSALERLRVAAEVSVDIDKRLPVQGGLGAGSANAVAALLGLERELGLALPGPERLRLAEEIGSDVPLFLLGGAVLGLGRGEQVFSLPDLPRTWCVVAVPSVGVSTAQAFRDLDAKMQRTVNSEQLTAKGPPGLKPPAFGEANGGAEALPLQNKTTEAEASPLQNEVVAVSPGLKPLQVGNSFSGLKAAAPSSEAVAFSCEASFERYGLQPVRNEILNQGALAPEGSASTEKAAAALTFAQPPDRLEELSRAYASVWTTAGLESGALQGTTGIAPDGVDLAENPLLTLVRTGIENDFEEVAFSQHPSLRSTKRDLQGDGNPGDSGCALYAALSGSGSALFGLYRNQRDAIAAQQRVQAAGTQALLTETLPRQAYWASMFAE